MKSGQTAGVINGKSVAEIFLCLRNAALAHVFHRRATDEIIRNSIDDIPKSRYNGSNKKNSLQKLSHRKRRILIMWLLIVPICLIIFYPFIRFFIKRISLIADIRHICRLKKFRYKANRFGAVFGNFKGKNCDFYIETADKLYSVKLCGTFFRKDLCDFMDEEHYAVRELAFQIAATRHAVRYKVKTKRAYDFKYKSEKAYSEKDLIPIILMNPVPADVTYHMKGIGNGDYIGEGIFYTGKGFCDKLRSE